MVLESFLGWLVHELTDAGTRFGLRLVRGSAHERALGEALQGAIASVAESAPEASRAPLKAALVEQLGAPPTIRELGPGVVLGEGIRQAMGIQLAPLADPSRTGTDRSFFEEIDVDGTRLVTDLADAFIATIQRVAASGDAAGLATLLGLEAIQSEMMALRRTLASAPAAALDGLPRDTTDFTNRDESLRRIVDLHYTNDRWASPVITIDGMAGVGKTALAVHVAHLIAADYPDARLFLELHAYSGVRAPVSSDAALVSLLRAMGMAPEQIPDGLDERAALWRSMVARKRVLVVLDDVTGPSQVRPLLPASPRCLVLVTSRRRLAGLEGTDAVSLGVLQVGGAVQLFRKVAGFDRTRDEIAEVLEVVELCGHLPIAVRLVAARMHHHTAWRVGDLLTELRATHDRLSEIHQGDVEIMATFELSYEGLAPDQQRMFRRLGAHPDQDFGVHAAAALVRTDVRSVKRVLDGLLDHNLVQEPRYGRYELHDLLHEYARRVFERDEFPSERAAVLDRLLDFYISMADLVDGQINLLGHRVEHEVEWAPIAAPSIRSHQEAVTWAETERLNLLTCVQIALDSDRRDRAARLAKGIAYLLRLKGYWSEALEFYDQMGAICSELGDRQGAADMRFLAGDIHRLTRRHHDAMASYEAALAEFRQLGDRYQAARSLHSIGDLERAKGRHDAALDAYEGARATYLELGNTHAEARALHSIGDTYRLGGRLDDAADCYQRLLGLYEDLGDRIGTARVRYGIGEIHRLAGRSDAAAVEARAALGVFKDLGDRLGEADALNSLGGALLDAGDDARASRSFDEARTVYRELFDEHGEARVLRGMAKLAVRGGHREQAAGLLREALAMLESLEAPEVQDVQTELSRLRSEEPG